MAKGLLPFLPLISYTLLTASEFWAKQARPYMVSVGTATTCPFFKAIAVELRICTLSIYQGKKINSQDMHYTSTREAVLITSMNTVNLHNTADNKATSHKTFHWSPHNTLLPGPSVSQETVNSTRNHNGSGHSQFCF